ncbi:hypothetical protein V5799_002980 [Amblyomma americanum]|uniref:Uncharacterized protein n=1 Tax=Amblyomma americanum TaxID=6943 RepID=A0AAQ4DA98_AMBAM
MAAVVPAILRARNSSQARDPTHRPPFAALTSVLCCQRPASIGPCVLPAFGCVIPPDPFMLKTKSHMEGCVLDVQKDKMFDLIFKHGVYCLPQRPKNATVISKTQP